MIHLFCRKPFKSQTSRDRPKSVPYPRLKNSIRTSKCQFTVLENRKSKKNVPSGAPGPASASPWRAKRGTLPKLSTFLSQLKGDPLEKKNIFEKKSHNAEKLKGRSLWGFSTSILSQNIKKLKGENFYFRNKNLTVPKKLKGGPFGIFQHPF